MTSIKMKTVRFRMIRTEMWEPECQVPAHMNEDEAMEYATENYSDSMHDEYMHKYTYDQETELSVIELDVPLDEQKDCSLVHEPNVLVLPNGDTFELGAPDVEDEYGPDGYGDGLS